MRQYSLAQSLVALVGAAALLVSGCNDQLRPRPLKLGTVRATDRDAGDIGDASNGGDVPEGIPVVFVWPDAGERDAYIPCPEIPGVDIGCHNPPTDAGTDSGEVDVSPYQPPVEDAGCNDCEDAEGFTDAEQDWFDAGDLRYNCGFGEENDGPDGNLAPIARACPYDQVPELDGVEVGDDGVCTYGVPRNGIDIDFSGRCGLGEQYCPRSEDPDGRIERYELCLGNGISKVSNHGSMRVRCDEPGEREAMLEVTDDYGATSTDRARFRCEE